MFHVPRAYLYIVLYIVHIANSIYENVFFLSLSFVKMNTTLQTFMKLKQ